MNVAGWCARWVGGAAVGLVAVACSGDPPEVPSGASDAAGAGGVPSEMDRGGTGPAGARAVAAGGSGAMGGLAGADSLGGAMGGEPSAPDPCADFYCGANSSCVADGDEPTCQCDAGFHGDGRACTPEPTALCKGVTCSGHGACMIESRGAECWCNLGFHPVGLTCEKDEPTCTEASALECVPGRKLSVCLLDRHLYYHIEDGKDFDGGSAAIGYCLGGAGADDGECSTIPERCGGRTEAECAALADRSCFWVPDFQSCSGPFTCGSRFDKSSCNAEPGCVWTPPKSAEAAGE